MEDITLTENPNKIIHNTLSVLNQSEISHSLTPILFGAASFQYLSAGCELGLFELLNNATGLTKDKIASYLELQQCAVDIILLG